MIDNKGISPTVMAICKRVAAARNAGARCFQPNWLGPIAWPYQPLLVISTYTAPNDSQKPLASKAQGSSSTTTKATSDKTRDDVVDIRNIYMQDKTASMKK